MALVSELHTTYPSDCPYVRAVREKYADWNWTLSHGYIRYGKGARTVVLEHRAVVELATGQCIDGLHVHHIDENPLNNASANLVALTVQEHARIHSNDRITLTCTYCGNEFAATPTQAKRGMRFCSRKCVDANRSQRPSRDVLVKAIYIHQNFCALGRHFGVSDNAVRKWAKYYQIDIRGIDGRLQDNVNFSQLADGANGDD